MTLQLETTIYFLQEEYVIHFQTFLAAGSTFVSIVLLIGIVLASLAHQELRYCSARGPSYMDAICSPVKCNI